MIHREALWGVHITCPRCGAAVTPVARGAQHAGVMLDTRAIVECVPCGDRLIVEVTLRSEQAVLRADKEIGSTIRREARSVERAGSRESA